MGLFNREKTDLEVLMSSTNIAGIEVKPFTLKQAEELLPEIELIIAELKQKKITIKNIEKRVVEATAIVLPRIKKVIAQLVNRDVFQVEEMPLVQVSTIVAVVIRQNAELLKNLIPLTQEIIKEARSEKK